MEIKDIYTHNLKGFSLKIPLNSLVVVTGPSGSGKSSLAIDTIAEEAKEKLFQIMNYSQETTLSKIPKAKFVSSIPPVIAMTQGVKAWYPYKTVGEFLSLYQVLRLLFEEFGEYKCFNCGKLNRISTLNKAISWYQNLKEGEKFYLLLPLPETTPKAIEFLISQGYTKYMIDEVVIDLSEEKIPAKFNKIYLLLDRMIKERGSLERFVENLRMSIGLNQGRVVIKFLDGEEYFFNLRAICLNCGSQLVTEWIKCKVCQGYGYKGKIACENCKGLKLDPLILKSKLFEITLEEWLNLSLKEFYNYLKNLKISESLSPWLESIFFKLEKANFLGMDYLKLSTPLFELSVGERKLLEILLIFSVNLNGILYILDEPTLGLDIERKKKLLTILKDLIESGNSVILIEHDPYIIQNADYIIELGPEGGEKGGYLIKADFKEKFFKEPYTLTSEYLAGKRKLKREILQEKRDLLEVFIKEKEVRLLKNSTNLIYGKVGSKKTYFFNKLCEVLEKKGERILKVEAKEIKGKSDLLVSYTGIWDDLREIFVKLPSARMKGLTKKNFSFYTKEGMCASCKGKGKKIWETENLKVSYVCEECLGKRLNPEVLNLTYKGFKISEILDFTIDEIGTLFSNIYQIREKVLLLKELNLSYLRLGQEINELSGGERNRLFIAKKFLEKSKFDYIFLEFPLQGLHLEDINRFSDWLNAFKRKEISVIVLETNPFVFFLCDWLIEVENGEIKFAGFWEEWLKRLGEENLEKEIYFYKKFFDY